MWCISEAFCWMVFLVVTYGFVFLCWCQMEGGTASLSAAKDRLMLHLPFFTCDHHQHHHPNRCHHHHHPITLITITLSHACLYQTPMRDFSLCVLILSVQYAFAPNIERALLIAGCLCFCLCLCLCLCECQCTICLCPQIPSGHFYLAGWNCRDKSDYPPGGEMRSLDRRSWEITFSPPFSGTHGGKKVSRRRTIYKSTFEIMSVWKAVLTKLPLWQNMM